MTYIQDWLEEAEHHAQAAGPGPWRWDHLRADLVGPPWDDEDQALYYVLRHDTDEPAPLEGDVRFLASARTDLPQALAAIRAALKVADDLRNPFRDPKERIIGQRIRDEMHAALRAFTHHTPGEQP